MGRSRWIERARRGSRDVVHLRASHANVSRRQNEVKRFEGIKKLVQIAKPKKPHAY